MWENMIFLLHKKTKGKIVRYNNCNYLVIVSDAGTSFTFTVSVCKVGSTSDFHDDTRRTL